MKYTYERSRTKWCIRANVENQNHWSLTLDGHHPKICLLTIFSLAKKNLNFFFFSKILFEWPNKDHVIIEWRQTIIYLIFYIDIFFFLFHSKLTILQYFLIDFNKQFCFFSSWYYKWAIFLHQKKFKIHFFVVDKMFFAKKSFLRWWCFLLL